MNKKLHIVMYHYVRDTKNSRYPKIKALDYCMFKKQIKFLVDCFNIVTMEEVIASYDQSYELPENAMILSFDDGYIDHFTNVFPILNEYNIQGSFFVPGKTVSEHVLLDVNKIHFILASAELKVLINDLFGRLDYYRGTEFNYESNEELFKNYAKASRFDSKEVIFIKRILQTVLPENLRNIITSELFEKNVGIKQNKFAKELYMNRDQIRCMKNNGMFIGLHGYDHYWLGNLAEDEIKKDVEKALECMSEFIHTDKWVMNYPYGSYNENVIKLISETGCKLGLTTELGIADLSVDNRFGLPRLDTNDYPPKSQNYKNIR